MPNSHWQNTPPSQFDIVACNFPEGDLSKPGAKLRPCLVLAIFQDELTGQYGCEVSYGTKILKLMERQHLDLIIQNAAHLRQLGLYRATRFDLDLVGTLPWTEEFFGCWTAYNSPVISALTETYIKEYGYQMMRRAN